MELTDKMIVEDAMHAGKVWFILGVIILIFSVAMVIYFRKKDRLHIKELFFAVLCVIFVGATFVLGFNTIKHADDYKVMSTVVVDKKYEVSETKTDSKGKKDTRENYYVYFENDFIPDTSKSGYNSCEVGDKVIIVHNQKSGHSSYYYGDYKYVGSKPIIKE